MASGPHSSEPGSSGVILTGGIIIAVDSLEVWGLPCFARGLKQRSFEELLAVRGRVPAAGWRAASGCHGDACCPRW